MPLVQSSWIRDFVAKINIATKSLKHQETRNLNRLLMLITK
jgi:hypothetical protein